LETLCRENSCIAFDYLQYHVHIRQRVRRDYDKQKAVVVV